MLYELVTAILAQPESKSVAVEAGGQLRKLWRRCTDRHRGHNRHQFTSGFFGEQALAVRQLPTRKLYLEPLRHILGRGVDAARGVGVIAGERRDGTNLSIDRGVRGSHVAAVRHSGMQRIAAAHPDLVEDPRLDEVLPRLSADGFDDF